MLLYVILKDLFLLRDVLEEAVFVLTLGLGHLPSKVLNAGLRGGGELALLGFQFRCYDFQEFDLIIDLFQHFVNFFGLSGPLGFNLACPGLILVSEPFGVPLFLQVSFLE